MVPFLAAPAVASTGVSGAARPGDAAAAGNFTVQMADAVSRMQGGAVARDIVLGTAPYHGRIYVLNRHGAKESTGHGSPLPHLVHGGPGRAGGGEEMGGIRGVLHYMQRTAVQGSPQTITRITNEWIPGAAQPSDRVHPFRKYFEELEIGETLTTHRRTVTETDIVNFAGLSGDFFYAHMDEIAAKESMFGRRVAHGYFVIAAAAGIGPSA